MAGSTHVNFDLATHLPPSPIAPSEPESNVISEKSHGSISTATPSPMHQLSQGLALTPTPHGSFIWRRNPFGAGWVVPDSYHIPTHILSETFRVLDKLDSPAHMGRVRYDTIKNTIERFHAVFTSAESDKTKQCLEKLEKQAERRRKHIGLPSLSDITLRWQQPYILESFQVTLSWKERIFFTLDISENSTRASQLVSWISVIAVILSISTFVVGTTQSANKWGMWLPGIEITCVSYFTFEYVVRLLTVPFARMELLNRSFLEDVIWGEQERELLTARRRLLKFLKSPMGLVDVISVVPFWIELGIGGVDLLLMESENDKHSQVLRIFRIVRLVRVIKLGVMTNSADLGEDRNMVLHLFTTVVSQARHALLLVVVLVIVAMLVFGTLIWVVERGELFLKGSPNCPVEGLCSGSSVRLRQLADGSYEESASPFESVPLSFWWVLVTITTVGYGDYFPVTPAGYVVGGITILYGVAVFALPVGIIGTAFSQAYDQFLGEQKLRKKLEERSEESSEADLSLTLDQRQVPQNKYPPLLLEFIDALEQNAMAFGLEPDIFQNWEESLKRLATFDTVKLKHPCETLEGWGTPVLGTLSQLALAKPLCHRFYGQTRAAWHRLLLHVAQAYEEFQESSDDSQFLVNLQEPVQMGTVKSGREVLLGRSPSVGARSSISGVSTRRIPSHNSHHFSKKDCIGDIHEDSEKSSLPKSAQDGVFFTI